MKVDRLHLIVHPGFIAESEDKTVADGKEPLGAAAIMMERYKNRLALILPSELVIIMLHMPPESVAQYPKGSLYLQLIDVFRSRLGKQLIATDQSGSVTDDRCIAKEFTHALEVAKSRGFDVSEDTPTVAYGETLLCCVPNCAERVNIAAHFRNKTVIQASDCDVEIPGGISVEDALSELPHFRIEFPHTRFVLGGGKKTS